MIKFKSIDLLDIVYFRDARLDLDWKGTTFVTGLNRNASASERRNGCGKSLLLSPLPHLAFGDPTGLSKNLARHSLLDGKDSRITWNLEADGVEWRISKARRGGRMDWSIHRDGEDVNPHTATIAEKLVADLMPFNEEEFYSLVYLDSRRPSPLLAGSAAARQSYLSNLLRINEFDRVREYVKERLDELGQAAAKRDALASTLSAEPADLKRLKSNARKGERALAKGRARLADAQERLRLRSLYEKHKDDLRRSEGFDMDEWRRMREYDKIWSMRTREELEWDAYQESVKEWTDRMAEKMRAAGWDGDRMRSNILAKWLKKETKAAQGRLDEANEERRRRRDLESERRSLSADREKAVRLLESVKVDPKGLAAQRREFAGELAQARADVDRLNESIANLEKHVDSGGSECPTCGSPLSAEQAAEQLRAAKLKLTFTPVPDALEAKLDAATEALAVWPQGEAPAVAGGQGAAGQASQA